MNEKIIISSGEELLEITPKDDLLALRNQAIQSTIQLLDIGNIAYIVYIDDKFDIEGQKEEFKAHLLRIKNEGQTLTSEKFKDLDWEASIPRFESQIVSLWDGSTIKKELLYEICMYSSNENSANVIPALEIKDCFGERIKLLTPNEWYLDNYNIIRELDENKKAICLFDYQFHSGNNLVAGRNGAHLVKSLLEQRELSNKIICGIFSHTFSEGDEDNSRMKYSEEYAIEPTKFYTISKSRFTCDPKISAFAEGIKNLLLLPSVEDFKKQAIKVFQECNQIAAGKIDKISPKTFNHIVQKSSLKEGVWEVSTLFRLYGILSKEENLRYISDPDKRVAFDDSIKNIRKIDEINTGYSSDILNEQLNMLRESEVYIPSELINSLHLPISNGDIFKIKNTEYILLVQPCNLALRAKEEFCGKRSYDYNNALLIPLREGDDKKLNSPAVEQIIKPGLKAKIKYATFSGFKNIPLDLLDLIVFNSLGESTLDMNQSSIENKLIHFPWLKRYQYIFKEFDKYEKALIFFNNIKEKLGNNDTDLRGLKPFIYAPECLRELKINGDNIYDYSNRVFKFDIKRIGHYKSPYSDDLLQKFMLYLSRNAFEHDFTNA